MVLHELPLLQNMNGEELIQKLESILRNYEFESPDVNMDYVIAECIVYIRFSEKKYKQLAELNEILRHNLRVAERKNKK